MSMDFEQYAALCARRRPACPDWFTQVLHASLGLAAAALAILEAVRDGGGQRAATRGVLEHLEEFEWQRALVYLEFDHRPVPVPVAPSVLAVDTALELAVRAGQCAGVVNDWMFQGGWLGERLPGKLHELDLHRARLYAALGVDEQAVWGLTVARPAPPQSHRVARAASAPAAPVAAARLVGATDDETGLRTRRVPAARPAPGVAHGASPALTASRPTRGEGIRLVLGNQTGHQPRSAA